MLLCETFFIEMNESETSNTAIDAGLLLRFYYNFKSKC